MGLLSLCALLGGISFGQVANLFAVTAASGVAGGAMGLLIALWRDRTFQSISLTILMVVFSVAGVELFAVAFPTVSSSWACRSRRCSIRIRAMLAVLYPRSDQITGVVRASSLVYIGVRLTFAALIVAFGTWMLRNWNPGHNEPREQADEAEAEVVESLVEVEGSAGRASRSPWAPASRRRPASSPGPAMRRRDPLGRTGGGASSDGDIAVRRVDRRRRPGCTCPGGPIAGSRPRPGPIAGPGPTRSSGAS